GRRADRHHRRGHSARRTGTSPRFRGHRTTGDALLPGRPGRPKPPIHPMAAGADRRRIRMLTVLGSGTQAVLAAAYASATSGQTVGVTDPEFATHGRSHHLTIDYLGGAREPAELVR